MLPEGSNHRLPAPSKEVGGYAQVRIITSKRATNFELKAKNSEGLAHRSREATAPDEHKVNRGDSESQNNGNVKKIETGVDLATPRPGPRRSLRLAVEKSGEGR